MHTQRIFVGVGLLTAIIFGFATLAISPTFAQTDDYGTGSTSGTYCPQLFQTVVRGSSGNQVLELQKFLSDYYDIPPATIQTGYFGRITQGYVIQFQKEQGLPSYGIVGPLTRAAIAKVCSNVSNTVGATFSASPTSGTAPLAVTFGASQLNAYKMYAIDFGDGSQSQSLTLNPPPCAYGNDCSNVYSANTSHTYSAAGTYTAKLFQNGLPLCAGCQAPVLGTVTITVTAGNQTSSTFSISPASGITPLAVTANINLSGNQTSSGCSYRLAWGDGTNSDFLPPGAHCDQGVSRQETHTYTAVGTYTATLTPGTGSPLTATVTVAANQTSATFSASPTSGQAPLGVDFRYTDTSSGKYYNIDYGDGSSGQMNLMLPPCSVNNSPCGFYDSTHVYQSSGTYTAKLTQGGLPLCYGCQPPILGTATITVTAQSTVAPHISSLSPTSGAIGTQVTIYGNGFTGDNDISFATGDSMHVAASNNGTTLMFTVPANIPGARCTAAPCPPTYTRQVTAGSYDISVSNANGSSNTLQFTVAGTPPSVSITSLSPSSGPAGTLVTVTGSGFSPTGNDGVNVIYPDGSGFGGIVPTSSNSGGTTLTFVLSHYPQLQPGMYSISVTNADSQVTSNQLQFSVTAQ